MVEILVQILQFTPYSEVGTEYFSPPPKMKIVRESKSERFRIPPQMKIVRVQIREVQNTPPPKMKIVREAKSKRLRISGRYMWRLICNPRDTTR